MCRVRVRVKVQVKVQVEVKVKVHVKAKNKVKAKAKAKANAKVTVKVVVSVKVTVKVTVKVRVAVRVVRALLVIRAPSVLKVRVGRQELNFTMLVIRVTVTVRLDVESPHPISLLLMAQNTSANSD